MDGIRDAEVPTRLVEMQSGSDGPDGPVDCLAAALYPLLRKVESRKLIPSRWDDS